MSEHKRQPSIVSGQLVRCSVSQLEKADERKHGSCLRAWGWEKIEHIYGPDSAPARESTRAHSMAERYFLTDELPDGNNSCERAFLAGRHMLPPREMVTPEMHFDGEVRLAGVPFNGKIDLWWNETQSDGLMTWAKVRDHKFLASLSKGLTSDQMERDAQMVGYGMVAIEVWAARGVQLTHVDLGHYLYSKDDDELPRTRETQRMVPVAVIRERWQSFIPVLRKMQEAASKRPLEIPGNAKACLAFGKNYPCPHLERCGDVKERKVSTQWTEAELAQFGGLVTKKQEVPAPTQAPASDIGPQTMTTTDQTGWKFVECEVCGMPMTKHGKRPPGHKIAPELCPNKASHEAAQGFKPANVLPPDAPAGAVELQAACEKCEDEKKNFQHMPEDCPKDEPVNGKPAKGKRGRKPKGVAAELVSEMNAKRAASAVEAAVEKVLESVAPGTVVEVACDTTKGHWVEILPRDHFAMAALNGLLCFLGCSESGPPEVARRAYEIADAMLEARNAGR